MEFKNLDVTMNFLLEYERNKTAYVLEEIQCQILLYLIKLGCDVKSIKSAYKTVLNKCNRYDNNYFGNICIMINLLEEKKEKQYLVLKDIKYNLSNGSNKKSDIDISNNIYEDINYEENIGTEKTKEMYKELQNKFQVLLSQDIDNKLDINEAQKWVKSCKKYIIMSFGRESEQFRKFMKIQFSPNILPPSPNAFLKLKRKSLQEGIEMALELLEES